MATLSSEKSPFVFRLVFVPALISLVITLWRLTGELLAWSASWFNPEAGGLGSIVGITWLAPIFGATFAFELRKEGLSPPSWKKAGGLILIGMLILFGGEVSQVTIYMSNYQLGLVYLWSMGILAAALQYPAWPLLFKTLFAYALAARIPVMLIMFFAMWGDWGTHYDAVPQGFPEIGWLSRFVWLGLFPQAFFWVSFTIVTGMFFGILAARLATRRSHPAL